MSKTRSIITLGSFDGVHRGHQAILKKVVDRARIQKAIPTALVFSMPPRFTKAPDERILLTTWEEKKQLLEDLGIKQIQPLIFNKKTASTSPEDFFTHTIIGRHHAVEMVVGPRVAFGKNRAGKLPLLYRLGKKAHVQMHVIQGVGSRHQVVSSSAIRAWLQKGQVEKAARALGRYYEVRGTVIKGDQRGRQMGFPTANLEVDSGKLLPPGVFWVEVLPLKLKGLCNIGTRPTFTPGETRMHVEVFLFGKVGTLYRRRLRLVFLRRVRAEKKFLSKEALIKQIRADVTKAKKWQKDFALQTTSHSI